MMLDKKFAEVLTQGLIEKIKTIEGQPQSPWFENVLLQPRNLDGQPYRGTNKFLLSLLDGGRSIPVYLTFLRAKKEGLTIQSGEKSLPVQYSTQLIFHRETKEKITSEEYQKLSEQEHKNYRMVFMMKHYNVFNVEQTNIKEVRPDLYAQLQAQCRAEEREVQEREHPLSQLVKDNGWLTPIYFDQVSSAFYRPLSDDIHLPPQSYFKSDDLFYSTLLHEMSHSTGHPDRLDRKIINSFGSPSYAREELVAELSSAIVGQHLHVSKTILEENALYLKSWLSSLRKDPVFLIDVLEDVLKASEMVVEQVQKNELSQNQSLESKELSRSQTQPKQLKFSVRTRKKGRGL